MNNEILKLKQLLSNRNDALRQLGIIMAVGQGMTSDELSKLCINKRWYFNHAHDYNVMSFGGRTAFMNYSLGDYNIHAGRNELIFRKKLTVIANWTPAKENMKYHTRLMFKLMIDKYLNDNDE